MATTENGNAEGSMVIGYRGTFGLFVDAFVV
jgi:hypothetical protein